MDNKRINILVTAAGSASGVNVIRALRQQNDLSVRIVATDSDLLAAGLHLADKGYVIPKASSSEFITALTDVCAKENIEILMPSFSAEYPVLAREKNKLVQQGIKIAISSLETIQICEDKRLTDNFFKSHGIAKPHLYSDDELRSESLTFPVFLKPARGRSSVNALRIDDRIDLNYYLKKVPDSIVQEFVTGIEHTVDVLSDLEGKMITAIPRVRIETKSGLATKSTTVKNTGLVKEVERIVNALGLVGISNVQCMCGNDSVKFIEVNYRMPAGGLPLDVAAGVNMPLLVVKMLQGYDVRSLIKDYEVGLTMVRYWETIFIGSNGEIVS